MAGAADLARALRTCGDTLRTCMVKAVLIKNEQARLEAATKCMNNYEQCKINTVLDPITGKKDVARLRKRLRRLERDKRDKKLHPR